jgi:hypothetical protein
MMQTATGCKVINITFAKQCSRHSHATNKMVADDAFHEPVMLDIHTNHVQAQMQLKKTGVTRNQEYYKSHLLETWAIT